jgi:hypothetical protein
MSLWLRRLIRLPPMRRRTSRRKIPFTPTKSVSQDVVGPFRHRIVKPDEVCLSGRSRAVPTVLKVTANSENGWHDFFAFSPLRLHLCRCQVRRTPLESWPLTPTRIRCACSTVRTEKVLTAENRFFTLPQTSLSHQNTSQSLSLYSSQTTSNATSYRDLAYLQSGCG